MKLHVRYQLLAKVTDAALMQDRVADVLTHDGGERLLLRDFYVPRVYPRRDGTILIQYRFRAAHQNETGERGWIVYGEFFPPECDRPSSPTDQSEACADLDDLRLRVWIPPHDPKLRALKKLLDSDRLWKTYRRDIEALGWDLSTGQWSIDLLGYRLGRRCVVRAACGPSDADDGDGASRSLVLKMVKKSAAPGIWTRLRQLEQGGFGNEADDGPRIPGLLFHHRETGAIAQRWESGANLHNMLGAAEFADGCEAAAEALDRLYSMRAVDLPIWRTDDELEQLSWWIDVTGRVYPAMKARLQTAWTRLVGSAPADDPKGWRVVHRDFYDKQILFERNRLVLLDCDTLSCGDPALDIGNFEAHLTWRELQEPDHRSNIVAGASVFRQCLHGADRDMEDRIYWWRAAATLRLICLYTWRPRWHNLVAESPLLRSRLTAGLVGELSS